MTVKKFSELTEEELDKIIDKHFSHWSQYSELMTLENKLPIFLKMNSYIQIQLKIISF